MSSNDNLPIAQTDEVSPDNFCGECGLSLKLIDPICQSRMCQKCDRRVYFQRHAPGGGFRVEEGEQFHITELKLSLDPMEGGKKNHFTRSGLDSFLRNLMTDGGLKRHEDFLQYCKEREQKLDEELSSLEYINHLDLNDEKQVNEAFEILKREGADGNSVQLIISSFFHEVYTKAEEGDSEGAARAAYRAAIFMNLQLLENEHYKEIIWLGYRAYVNLRQNEGISQEEAQEKLLVEQAAEKLRNFSYAHLISLSQAEDPLSVPLGVKGVREKGLRALVEHEVERRKKAPEEAFRSREVSAKESEQTIKKWHLYVVILGLLVKVAYDYFMQ
jgi:hypothetical protein